MRPPRLSPKALTDHLVFESAAVRRTVRALRKAVLKAAPGAAEAIRFRALCYFHEDAWFGAIGGHICFIEVKKGEVLLSFIHGAQLSDPAGLMFGKGKFKRFVRVTDAAAAGRRELAALVRASAKLRPWE